MAVKEYARKGLRSQGAIERIRRFLESKGFAKVSLISDEEIATVSGENGERGFPNEQQLRRDLQRVVDFEAIDNLPPSIKKVLSYGAIAPVNLTVTIEARKKAKEPTTVDTLQSILGNQFKLSDLMVVEDYLHQAKGNPSTALTNAGRMSVDKMRTEIIRYMDARRDDVPKGYRFQLEYDELTDYVYNDMDNNEIIALYGIFDRGEFLANMTEYESKNDGVNTRGMFQLKQQIAIAKSYRGK